MAKTSPQPKARTAQRKKLVVKKETIKDLAAGRSAKAVKGGISKLSGSIYKPPALDPFSTG
jgi:hypothetical protein